MGNAGTLQTTYIHGSEPGEQSRLTRLNQILNAMCLRELRLEPGCRVLDVGAGLGQFTRDMARAAGAAVVAVERDARQREEALHQATVASEAHLLDLRAGEATALPLEPQEWGSFDLVHARFVLEHVPDAAGVVAQMARAARPGGRVVVSDDDHSLLRLRPEPPGSRELWEAYMRAYDRIGCDPFIGTRLVELLAGAGVRPVRSAMLNFGACAGEAHWADMVENFIGVVETARERIVGGGLMEAGAYAEAIAAFRAWGRRGDAAIWYPLCWAEGVRVS